MGGEGNLVIENVADAKFVDDSKHNYRIQNNSPAIDAGVEVSEVTKDLDGENRPVDGLYDVGADEYYASLGLQDSYLDKIQIFPNPVDNNKLFYNLKDGTIIKNFYLRDINGRKIYSVDSFNQNYMDVSSIPTGIYFGYFELNSKLIIKKIIIQ